MNLPLYLDYNASTPIDEHVLSEIILYMKKHYANPSSTEHIPGMSASVLLEKARETLAKLINAEEPDNIIFTSGASESNNMVIRGIYDYFSYFKQEKVHIVTSTIEHKCILNCCEHLKKFGATISYAPVDHSGKVDVKKLEELIRPETRLITIMAANNETGVFQPIKEISTLAKNHGILFHIDAAQLIGKYPFNINEVSPDFASFSSHKFYGPKGVGGLYISNNEFHKKAPLINGGDQELGLRGGTVNLPGIAGMAKAAENALKNIDQDVKAQYKIKSLVISKLKSKINGFTVNGDEKNALPTTINFSIKNVDAKLLLRLLKNKLHMSTGSACSSNLATSSHVLKAMGLNSERCLGAIRLSFGRGVSENELMHACDLIISTVEKIKG